MSRQNGIGSSNFATTEGSQLPPFSSAFHGDAPDRRRLYDPGDISGLCRKIGDTATSPAASTISFGGFGISLVTGGASDGRFGLRPRLLNPVSPFSSLSSRLFRLEFHRFFTE